MVMSVSDLNSDISKTHGHTFNLFTFTWYNHTKEIKLFEIIGWDHGDVHSSSLIGLLVTPSFIDFNFCFMNFGHLREK